MRFDIIVFRELTAAIAVTALYGIVGWDMGEPLAVFSMFAAGLFLQEWLIDKYRERRHRNEKPKTACWRKRNASCG